ncbi:MAG: hypothetical protein IH897_01735 [Planctomycetes bacterium]|nr:hypothetical protein [Planctomycetota bacterium]
MADNPQQDAPLPDPEGTGGEVVSEDDLDALLVEASQLASEISGEVGGAQTDATPLSAENQLESDPSDLSSLNCDDIDSQLTNLDRLVDESQSEIGAPTLPIAADVPSDSPPGDASTSEVDRSDLSIAGDPDAEDASSKNTGDSTAPSEVDLPDFMQEFTQPASDSTQRSENLWRSDLSEPASETLAVSPALQPATQEAKAKSDEFAQSTGQAAATDHAGRKEGMRLLIMRLSHALSPIAFRATDKAVSVLEVVNSPTQRIGGGIRTAVGWLAIATIGTSVLVFLTSLF